MEYGTWLQIRKFLLQNLFDVFCTVIICPYTLNHVPSFRSDELNHFNGPFEFKNLRFILHIFICKQTSSLFWRRGSILIPYFPHWTIGLYLKYLKALILKCWLELSQINLSEALATEKLTSAIFTGSKSILYRSKITDDFSNKVYLNAYKNSMN